MTAPFVSVSDLSVTFVTRERTVRAVERTSFAIESGEIVGLVGESGCGKSVTSLSVMGLVPQPPGEVEAEAMRFEGRDGLCGTADEQVDLACPGTAYATGECGVDDLDPGGRRGHRGQRPLQQG